MDEPRLFSNRAQKKARRRLLKRLRKAYKVAHGAWGAMNYYDVFFDDEFADGLKMTPVQFEEFQKRTVNLLSQYCKIAQTRIVKMLNSETL